MLVILWIKLFHSYFISINFAFFFQECMTSSVKHVCANASMDIQKVNTAGHLFVTIKFLIRAQEKKKKTKKLISEDIAVKLNQVTHT